MAARIRSLRNFITPVDEASRNDLVVADVVTVQSLDAASTYAWALAFVPEGSTAAFSGSLTAVSPGSFTVDVVGPYLVRLTVDATLPTESTQWVRLRALTTSLGLRLVAAGERRDESGIIPVDVDPVGWAYNQNFNLLALEAALASVDTLAQTLVAGNVTGGTNIVLTAGDILAAGSSPAAPVSALGTGRIRYNNTSTAFETSVNGGPWTAIGSGSGGSILEYHEDMPEAPNSTVRYRGWVPVTATLLAVRVYMQTVNTVGTYTLAVKNEATGNTVLSAATFNMNTLGAATVTSVSLTGVPADLAFAALGRWTISLVSNNAGFNGVGVYVELQFGIGLTGAAGQDLATTLTFGNVTGGNDIILNSTDIIRGEEGVALAGDVFLRGGTATGGVADGGDIIFRPGAGVGGGVDGEVILRNSAGGNNIHLSVTAAQQITIGTTLPLVYNATTGKLTVPGLIDPTGIIFERAGPPATTATEGAVFVSDGSAGLTLGNLYFRAASNGANTDLTSGGGSSLAATLLIGNTTSGTNLEVSNGDYITGHSATGGSNPGKSLLLRGGLGDGAGTAASDVLTVNVAPPGTGISFSDGVGYSATLSGAGGPRTPGSNNYNDTLVTVGATATEIAAALNDPLNSFSGWLTALAAGPNITVTANIVGTIGNAYSVSFDSGDISDTGFSGGVDPVRSGPIVPELGQWGAIQASTSGDTRGRNAVDLQGFRYTSSQVASGQESFIGGGRGNKTSGPFTVIAGGYLNIVSADFAVVAGGNANEARALKSLVGSGTLNIVELGADSSSIVGGENNTITAGALGAVIAGGVQGIVAATGSYSAITNGASVQTQNQFTRAGGVAPIARNYGEDVYSSGNFGGVGAIQRSEAMWFALTTNATPQNLFLDNVSEQYIVPDESALKFTWEVVARKIGFGAGPSGGWKVSGVVKRAVGVATIAVVGTPSLEVTGVDAALATATITVTVDVATGALVPQVTGVAATNIKWAIAMTAILVGN